MEWRSVAFAAFFPSDLRIFAIDTSGSGLWRSALRRWSAETLDAPTYEDVLPVDASAERGARLRVLAAVVILGGVEDDLREPAAESGGREDPAGRVELRPARGRTFLPEVTGVEFSSARRGYDRAEVDRYVERVSRIVVELEAMRSPDAVIERALADVGEETSAILRRARRAGEEIVSEAQAQADQRIAEAELRARELREQADHDSARMRAAGEQALSQARSEAEGIIAQAREEAGRLREEADRYRTQVGAHIEQLARERHRLIEDLRKLADQFHRTADRALEQIPTEAIAHRPTPSAAGPTGTDAGSD